MKTCFKCHKIKPLSDFYRHLRMADGHLNKCKECTRKDVSERELRLSLTDFAWKEKELERHRIKAAKSRSSGISAKKSKEAGAKWDKANRHKKYAHTKVYRAILDGKLTPHPCEVCGLTKVDAHHDDYSKPLDVKWLCRKHHAERHREINRQRRFARFQERQK